LFERVRCIELASDGLAERRREDRIHSHSYHVLEKGGDDLSKDTSINLYARIRVGLDEEWIKLIIKHEIQSKELKRILFS